ncbi:MAG: MBL fold metallo-hydrolase [Carboxydocellales bacterium]
MANMQDLDLILRDKTEAAILNSREKWKERKGRSQRNPGWGITFLGTGGNPESVIAQRPRTAGFLVEFGNLFMYVDPGPGALQGVLEARVDLGNLDAVYISHGHVDHYAGAESIIEGMCWAMSTRRGLLMGPKNIFEVEHSISRFHQGETEKYGYMGGPEVVHLEAGKTLTIKDVQLTPVRAYHGGENYGFILEAGGLRLGYTGDTNYILAYSTPEGIQEVKRFGPIMDFQQVERYREDIREAFSQVDVLIANITSHNSWVHRHITGLGLAHLLQNSQVKLCYLSHFNYCCVEPEDIRFKMAEYVEGMTGIPTRAAQDMEHLDLTAYLTKAGDE